MSPAGATESSRRPSLAAKGRVVVRPVQASEIPALARVIARAFAWHEPWGAFCFPDDSQREDRLAELAEYDLAHSYVPAGCAWAIEGSSVAMWIPPDGHPLAAHFGPDRRDSSQYEIYGERADLVRANDRLINELRPAFPHWYLDTLATDPERFGEGLAGRLVEHGLAVCDDTGVPVALDVHLERNRRFYARWGFEVSATGRIPGEALDVAIMVRGVGGRS